MMKEDNELKHSFRERTHAEKMRAIGIEPPEHVPKRFKTAWDQLVNDFPCPPELQQGVGSENKMHVCKRLRVSRGLEVWVCEM